MQPSTSKWANATAMSVTSPGLGGSAQFRVDMQNNSEASKEDLPPFDPVAILEAAITVPFDLPNITSDATTTQIPAAISSRRVRDQIAHLKSSYARTRIRILAYARAYVAFTPPDEEPHESPNDAEARVQRENEEIAGMLRSRPRSGSGDAIEHARVYPIGSGAMETPPPKKGAAAIAHISRETSKLLMTLEKHYRARRKELDKCLAEALEHEKKRDGDKERKVMGRERTAAWVSGRDRVGSGDDKDEKSEDRMEGVEMTSPRVSRWDVPPLPPPPPPRYPPLPSSPPLHPEEAAPPPPASSPEENISKPVLPSGTGTPPRKSIIDRSRDPRRRGR